MKQQVARSSLGSRWMHG